MTTIVLAITLVLRISTRPSTYLSISNEKMTQTVYSIQFARIFAAFIVFLGHWAYVYDVGLVFNGSIGVDIFFIVSGFVISLSMTNYNSILDFIRQRIKRIYPTYLVAAIPIIAWNYTTLSFEKLIKNILLIPIHWSGSIDFALVPAWTLSYEIFFYLLSAIIYFYVRPFLAKVTLISILFIFIVTNTYPIVFLNSLLLEFAFGYILFLVYCKGRIFKFLFALLSVGLILTFEIYSYLDFSDAIVSNAAGRSVISQSSDEMSPRGLMWGSLSLTLLSVLILFENFFLKCAVQIKYLANHSYEFYLMQYYWFFITGLIDIHPIISFITGLLFSLILAILLRRFTAIVIERLK